MSTFNFFRGLTLVLHAAFSIGAIITDPSGLLPNLTYDYIIVGGGTAGLTLATRLSEILTNTILVLEAGGSDANLIDIEAPFLAPIATPNTEIDWNYTASPQAGLNNRVFPLPSGRVLGGSSSVNYLIHQYGTNDDWNRMAGGMVGDVRWNWTNMQQYVATHEHVVAPLDGHNTSAQMLAAIHSTTGPFPISLPGTNQSTDSPLINTLGQLPEFGPYNGDMSGVNSSIIGFGFAFSSIAGGVRSSSSTAYLGPVLNTRPNMTVLLNATVMKVVQTGINGTLKEFRAVQFTSSRTSPVTTVTANKMVILSAGAIGTPHILMLSGIGNATALKALNISVLINTTSVGQNLSDSVIVPNYFSVNSSLSTLDVDLPNEPGFSAALSQWQAHKNGTFSNNLVNMLGYARLPSTAEIFTTVKNPQAGAKSPHYEIIPLDFFIPGVTPHPQTSANFLTFISTLSSPTSRGSITLQSASIFDPPIINPNYLTSDFDIFTMREAVRAVQRLVAAPVWAKFNITPFGPMVPASATNDTVDAYVQSMCTTVFHYGGTTAMTSTARGVGDGVVDADLTVKGTVGLRIVDSSVWPFIPSTHPQGAVYILAEKAADIIKAAG